MRSGCGAGNRLEADIPPVPESLPPAFLPHPHVTVQESSLQWLPAVGPSGQNVTAPPSEPWLAAWWRKGSGGSVGGFGADSRPTVLGAIDAFSPRDRALGALGGEGPGGVAKTNGLGKDVGRGEGRGGGGGRGGAVPSRPASHSASIAGSSIPPNSSYPDLSCFPSCHPSPCPCSCTPPPSPLRQAAATPRHRRRQDTGGVPGAGRQA